MQDSLPPDRPAPATPAQTELGASSDWRAVWREPLHAGVDEVGIGPLAGPVTAAAVILHPDRPIEGLTDSKVLSAKKRAALATRIRAESLGWAIGWADVAEIDRLNILQASHLAMQRAVAHLVPAPLRVLVDGNKVPALAQPVLAVVQGDRHVPQISAASILAKVARDALMEQLHERYPHYGFDRHKGYPTAAHLRALDEHGVSGVHRHSFAPVANRLTGTDARAAQNDLAVSGARR